MFTKLINNIMKKNISLVNKICKNFSKTTYRNNGHIFRIVKIFDNGTVEVEVKQCVNGCIKYDNAKITIPATSSFHMYCPICGE